MADISYSHSHSHAAPRAQGFFSRLGARLGRWMEDIAVANARVRQVERLNAMSDEQLAKRGLTRDQIVHHVFRDVMYY